MSTLSKVDQLKDLATNSPLNDESRLQVLIHLTAQLAEDLAQLRHQLGLEKQP